MTTFIRNRMPLIATLVAATALTGCGDQQGENDTSPRAAATQEAGCSGATIDTCRVTNGADAVKTLGELHELMVPLAERAYPGTRAEPACGGAALSYSCTVLLVSKETGYGVGHPTVRIVVDPQTQRLSTMDNEEWVLASAQRAAAAQVLESGASWLSAGEDKQAEAVGEWQQRQHPENPCLDNSPAELAATVDQLNEEWGTTPLETLGSYCEGGP